MTDAWHDSVRRDTRVVLGKHGDGAATIGPNLQLLDCEVVLDCPEGALSFVRTTMLRCRISASKPVKRINFTGARIVDCTFQGRFVECDFGHMTIPFDYGGSVERCDFSAAVMDSCRIFDANLDSLRLPSAWPQIVLKGNYRELSQQRFASAATIDEKVFFKVLSDADPSEVAQIALASSLAKRMGMSEQELRAFVATLPFAFSA